MLKKSGTDRPAFLFAMILSAFSTILAPAQPTAAPSSAPPSTSLGQWTYRYSREKAITSATARAGFHRGLPAVFRANTAAKDAAVWPEGNDASVGAAISSSTSPFTAKGRMRPIRGFRMMLQLTRSRINPQATEAPYFRWPLMSSRMTARMIHSSPWLAVRLMAGSTASRKPQRRWACIQSRMANSAACMKNSFPGRPRRARFLAHYNTRRLFCQVFFRRIRNSKYPVTAQRAATARMTQTGIPVPAEGSSGASVAAG